MIPFVQKYSFSVFFLSVQWIRLFLIPLVAAIHTLVKDRHGLICRSDLYLHKIGFGIVALGAVLLGSIHIVPSFRSSQNIIHSLSERKCLFGDRGLDGARVGTSDTIKVSWWFLLSRVFHMTNLQQSSIQWTKPHIGSKLYSLRYRCCWIEGTSMETTTTYCSISSLRFYEGRRWMATMEVPTCGPTDGFVRVGSFNWVGQLKDTAMSVTSPIQTVEWLRVFISYLLLLCSSSSLSSKAVDSLKCQVLVSMITQIFAIFESCLITKVPTGALGSCN